MWCKISTVFIVQQFPRYISQICTIKLKFLTRESYSPRLSTKLKFTNFHRYIWAYLPLLNSSLDDSVVEAMLFLARRFFKVVDAVDPGMVDSSLQHAQTSLSTGLRSGLLGGRNHGGIRTDSCWNKYSTVSPAWWARALSSRMWTFLQLYNGWRFWPIFSRALLL